MCHFSSILGGGDVLFVQALTAVSIAASIALWIAVYRKARIRLEPFIIPICLWVAFGTLDILITAKGTFEDPLREGNPLARLVFVETGFLGPVVASILWIALWSFAVLLINKRLSGAPALFLSLAVFYSLAAGHVYGFGTWYEPLCGVSGAYLGLLSWIPRMLRPIPPGIMLALIHMAALPPAKQKTPPEQAAKPLRGNSDRGKN